MSEHLNVYSMKFWKDVALKRLPEQISQVQVIKRIWRFLFGWSAVSSFFMTVSGVHDTVLLLLMDEVISCLPGAISEND